MPRRLARWSATLLAAAVLLLWAANVPFYSGSDLGPNWGWRMEHGRITLNRHATPQNPESFYIAPNSEALRWGFGGRYGSSGWSVTIPLWAIFLPTAAAAALLWRRPRTPGRCRRCGYDLASLPAGAPCPECGRAAPGA
ncbi:MAG: hypothetical protein WD749_10175 [Phycisphaerales bacterium]